MPRTGKAPFYTTPLQAADFILGYTLPILPIAVTQSIICYITAILLGLPVTITIFYAVLFIIPVSLLFISLGLFFGSLLNVKQAGGVCGALLTNLTAWLSGIWFDLDLVGGIFKKIADVLPFVHAVELERAVLSGNYGEIFPHIFWVTGYMIISVIAAIAMFTWKMKRQ